LDGRTVSGGYRFGFNTQEMVDDISGNGNHLSWGNYGMDPRLGRRWDTDPQANKIPYQSTYSVNNNSPISVYDPDGQFGILGALIGASIGAVGEFGAQVASNLVQGNPAFSRIDWADVAISAGEGALIGVTGGLSFGATLAVKSGSATLRTVIDYKDGKLSTAGGLIGKKKENILSDAAGEFLGLGVGLLPMKGLVRDIVADQFVKNGIKSEGKFLMGLVTSEITGGLVMGLREGIYDGLYNKVKEEIEFKLMLNVLELPPVIVSRPVNGKMAPNDKKKVHDHIRKNLDQLLNHENN